MLKAEDFFFNRVFGDEAAGEAKERGSHGNVFERLGAWRALRTLNQHRAAETGELRTLLIEVAKSAPPGALPDSETEVRSAVDLEAQAASVDAQIESNMLDVDGPVARRAQRLRGRRRGLGGSRSLAQRGLQ